MAYITWTAAKVYVDRDAMSDHTGDLDMDQMTQFIATIEGQLNNRLRRYMTVPVDATSTDTYEQVKDICAMQSAAMYLRWAYSAQGIAEEGWWADKLDQLAENAIANLTTNRSAPTDATAASSPLQYIPYDGKVQSSTEPDAVFGRDNVATGSGHW